jgi:hypothetical protein
MVYDPRRNALLKEGSANDRIDARKLAELLRLNSLRSVYHGENGLRTLKELARAYLTISKDLVRVLNRVKAIYRSWGIPCAGRSVYNPRHREEWLCKITQASVRRRAELFYEQLDALVRLRKQARQELLAESKKHPAWKLLRSIPALAPIRAAVTTRLSFLSRANDGENTAQPLTTHQSQASRASVYSFRWVEGRGCRTSGAKAKWSIRLASEMFAAAPVLRPGWNRLGRTSA